MTGPTGRIGVLTSYVDATAGTVRKCDDLEAHGIPVMWDSGAFSVWRAGKTIDVDEHALWVRDRQRAGSTARYVALDVITSGDASLTNWRRQTTLGAVVEPTVHYGEPLRLVDEYVEAGTRWMNVGGLAQRSNPKSERDKALGFFAAIAKRSGDTKLHGLGATHPAIAWHVPYDACDSIYWRRPGWGTLPLFDVRIGDWRRLPVRMDRRQPPKKGWRELWDHAAWVRDEYGSEPAEWHVSNPEVYRLSIESHRRYAQWIADRHSRDVTVYLAGGAGEAERIKEVVG